MKCKNLKIKTNQRFKFGNCELKDKKVDLSCDECPFEVKYDMAKKKN